MPTLPNGIWVPGPSAPIDFHVTPTILAAAAGNALAGRLDGVRPPTLLLAANGTEFTNLTALQLEVGDQIFRSDTGVIWELTDSGWRMERTITAQTYTPGWGSTHFLSAGGTTVSNFAYWVDGDRVRVFGVLYLGNATVHSSTLPVRIPVPSGLEMDYAPTNLGVIGSASVYHASLGIYMGQVHGMYGSYAEGGDTTGKIYPSLIFRTASGDVGMSNVSPIAWGSYPATQISVAFEYSRQA